MIHQNNIPIPMPSPEGSPAARKENWLWLYLRNTGANFSLDSFRSSRMMSDMEDYARTKNENLKSIRENQMSFWLLPEERLNWITNEKRQHKWLLPYINRQLNFAIYPVPPLLLGRSFVIATVDIWNVDLQKKTLSVEQMERDWNKHKLSDDIFAWFQDENEAFRCELAWKWLKKNLPLSFYELSPISSYQELLIFFDGQFNNGMPMGNAEKMQIVEKIKRQAAQQKHREKRKDEGKIQCNVELSKKAANNLNKLASKYNISKAQVIETLIQFETEKNQYLPEKVRLIAAWKDPSIS